MSTDLERRGNQTVAPRTIESVFTSDSFKAQVAAALPAHIKPESMMRIALTEVRLNPELLKCTPASFMGALLKASQAGLRPGMFGECWILPRWNGKTQSLEAQFQSGYQGLVQLVYKSGEVSEVLAEAVYAGDHFRYELGSDPKIEHTPALDAEHSWDSVVAFYAVIRMTNGGKLLKVMSRKQVEEHRDRFAPRNKAKAIVGPWVSDPIPMGCKTVLLQVLKFAPKETERLAIAMADNDAVFNDRVAEAVIDRGQVAAERVASRLGVETEPEPESAEVVDDDAPYATPEQLDEDIDTKDYWDGEEEPQAGLEGNTATDNGQTEANPTSSSESSDPATPRQIKLVYAKAKEAGVDAASLKDIVRLVGGVEHLPELPFDKVDSVLEAIADFTAKRPTLGAPA